MIALIILSCWILTGIATFRRTGYMNEYRLKHGAIEHEFKSICNQCRCATCGDNWGHHYTYRGLGHACHDYVVDERTIHHSTVFLGLVTLALWPGFLTYFTISAVRSKLGIEPGSFFVPPPTVDGKEAKARRELEEAKRLNAEAEARNEELQETIRRLEHENGILPKSGRRR